jgi:peptide/nickel transport system ATP-binding protein
MQCQSKMRMLTRLPHQSKLRCCASHSLRQGSACVPLLEIENLRTYLFTRRGVNRAVDGVSLTLDRGKTVGIVGESGSGKSMTALSIMRLLPEPYGRIVGGSIRFDGQDLVTLKEREMRRVRGARIAIIPQDPMTSLNPVFSIGFQIGETVAWHKGLRGRARRDRIIESLRAVRLPTPEARARDYPHQLSGGMRQRVVGAIGVACEPKLLIADEATTALDTTTQAHYLEMLRSLQRKLGLALLFITHDFGVVARMCDDVAVMYAGRVVEHGNVRQIFARPAHPYTKALIDSSPPMDHAVDRLPAIRGTAVGGYAALSGCSFADRCDYALDTCRSQKPPRVEVGPGHTAECWRASEFHSGLVSSEAVT